MIATNMNIRYNDEIMAKLWFEAIAFTFVVACKRAKRERVSILISSGIISLSPSLSPDKKEQREGCSASKQILDRENFFPELLAWIYSAELSVEPFFRAGDAAIRSQLERETSDSILMSLRVRALLISSCTRGTSAPADSPLPGKFAFRASNSNALFVINGFSISVLPPSLEIAILARDENTDILPRKRRECAIYVYRDIVYRTRTYSGAYCSH